MQVRTGLIIGLGLLVVSFALGVLSWQRADAQAPQGNPPPDAVQAAQTPSNVPQTRPEQRQTEHDRSSLFAAPNALPSSTAIERQPDQGQIQRQAAHADFRADHAGRCRPEATGHGDPVATSPQLHQYVPLLSPDTVG